MKSNLRKQVFNELRILNTCSGMNTTELNSIFKDQLLSINLTYWHTYAQTTALTSFIFAINLESSTIKQQHLSIFSTIAAGYGLLPVIFFSWTLIYMAAVLICLPVHYKQISAVSNFLIIFTTCLCSKMFQDVLYAYFAICLLVHWIVSLRRRRYDVVLLLTAEVCAVAYFSFMGWYVSRLICHVYGGLRKHRNLHFAYFATLLLLLALNEDCHRMQTFLPHADLFTNVMNVYQPDITQNIQPYLIFEPNSDHHQNRIVYKPLHSNDSALWVLQYMARRAKG